MRGKDEIAQSAAEDLSSKGPSSGTEQAEKSGLLGWIRAWTKRLTGRALAEGSEEPKTGSHYETELKEYEAKLKEAVIRKLTTEIDEEKPILDMLINVQEEAERIEKTNSPEERTQIIANFESFHGQSNLDKSTYRTHRTFSPEYEQQYQKWLEYLKSKAEEKTLEDESGTLIKVAESIDTGIFGNGTKGSLKIQSPEDARKKISRAKEKAKEFKARVDDLFKRLQGLSDRNYALVVELITLIATMKSKKDVLAKYLAEQK